MWQVQYRILALSQHLPPQTVVMHHEIQLETTKIVSSRFYTCAVVIHFHKKTGEYKKNNLFLCFCKTVKKHYKCKLNVGGGVPYLEVNLSVANRIEKNSEQGRRLETSLFVLISNFLGC